MVSALGNLSRTLAVWGRYEEAVDCAISSIRMMQQHHLTRNRNYVIALNGLAILYAHLNQDAMAEKLLREALAFANEATDAPMQLMLQSNLGLLCWRSRDWEKGLIQFQETLKLAHRARDVAPEGEISLNIACGLTELGRLDEATTMLLRAFQLARSSGNRELERLVILAESRLYEKQNRLDEAARSAERALSIAMASGTNMHRMAAMHMLARLCIQLQKLERAAELLDQVIQMEEAVSRDLHTDLLLTSVFDTQVRTYEDLQWVQVQLGRYNEALVSAERGRARVLARWLAERDAGMDNPPDLDEIRRIAAEVNTSFLVLSLVRAPAHLFDRKADTHALIWVVPPDLTIPIAFHRSPSFPDTQPQPSDPNASDPDLRTMYDWFIAPVAHALPADSSTIVTIVPTAPLAVWPLAAACDPDGVWLIERHPVAMTPSIQTLRLATMRESRGEGALVIGDPELDLPSASAEAESIAERMAQRMPTSAFIGRDATHDAVAQSMPGKWLLHFASHAVFDSSDVDSYHGALLLNGGRLTAEEIRAMPLDAELVVLSACDTGQGRIAADGVLGLARSFILAGARSVIATLWQIPDEPTRLLIEHFYERIAVHNHKALALQEAILHVKAIPGYAAPYHWAGFMLIGDPLTKNPKIPPSSQA